MQLVASGRPAHELTVDLIYAEIRQGSRTTINDELKLWKDEQTRNDALAKGDVDIGLTFVSEIITEPGVEVVGPLPESISTPTRLVGFIGSHAKDQAAAKELLQYLSGPDAAKVYKERGMVAGR